MVLDSVTSTPQWIQHQPEPCGFVHDVFECECVLGRSRVSQPLNLRLCLLHHFGSLTLPRAIKTRSRCHLSSCRLLRCSTPTPHPIQRACSDCDISPGPGQDTGTPLARPGHTHCDVDRIIGLVTSYIRNLDVSSFEELKKYCMDSFTVAVS